MSGRRPISFNERLTIAILTVLTIASGGGAGLVLLTSGKNDERLVSLTLVYGVGFFLICATALVLTLVEIRRSRRRPRQ